MKLNTINSIKELSEEEIKKLNPIELGKAFTVAFGHGSLTAFANEINKSYTSIYRTFKGLSNNPNIIEQAQAQLIEYSNN